ncbi:hypothetical protein VPHD63_0030 [Vibrio phage D63]
MTIIVVDKLRRNIMKDLMCVLTVPYLILLAVMSVTLYVTN